jgi:hypothetical protein
VKNILPAVSGNSNPTGRVEPTERDEMLLMLLHGGAASNSIATWRLDRFTSEIREQALRDAARDLRAANANWSDDEAAVVRDEIAEWLDQRAAKGGTR